MNCIYGFTIFTDVFNEVSTPNCVYDRLKTRTFRNFEWAIVDDGSTDNVMGLVEQCREKPSSLYNRLADRAVAVSERRTRGGMINVCY